ncbi:MAG: hypothetical protein JKY96_07685 [Phycisphaerales bacterium]|nr:hypothetical protein [Phycisphaerales bacterium]
MPQTPTQNIDPVAALAAALFPGAGQMVRKRTLRGVLACVGVLGLFFFGLLIGGIDAIDSKEDRIWFIAEAMVGPPTFIVDYVHQNNFKAYDTLTRTTRTGNPNEHRVQINSRWQWEQLTAAQMDQGMGPPNTKGLGRLNEIAMLSIVLAGMLNLIIFLDALMPPTEKQNPSTKQAPKESPA